MFASFRRSGLGSILCLIAWTILLGSSELRGESSTKFRILWGGGANRLFEGDISIDQGSLTLARPLGISPMSGVESISLTPQTIQIKGLAPTTFGGVDILVHGKDSSKIRLRFQDGVLSGKGNQPSEVASEWTLEELCDEAKGLSLDQEKSRVVIARAPGDVLRVRIDRPHVLFEPGEAIPLGIELERSKLGIGQVPCHIQLVRVDQPHPFQEKTILLELDAKGSSPLQALPSFRAPMEEGVYQLHFSLENKKRGWGRGTPIERTIEFVVLGKGRAQHDPADWKLEQRLRLDDGAKHASFLRRIAGIVRSDGEPTPMTLEPGEHRAIELDIEDLGKPHQIRFDLQDGQDMKCTFSILEPSETGRVEGMTLDGAFASSRFPWLDGNEELNQSIVFWPRSKEAKLLIYNPSPDQVAVIRNIELWSGPLSLEPLSLEPASRGSSVQEEGRIPRSNRLVALTLDRPFLQDAFGGRRWLDPQSNRPLDSWQTFYDTAVRLVEYCRAMGYNGAAITALSDGSTLYPSRLLNSTPRFDSGVFASDGRDPMQKDVIELFLRIFEREGLELVLVFDFNSPILQLESKRAKSMQAYEPFDQLNHEGVRVQPINGQPNGSQPNSGNRFGEPRYEPLDPQLQTWVSELFREFQTRYQQRTSWRGNALRLGTRSHLCFRGELWGFGESQIDAFEKEMQAKLPFENRRAFLLGSHQQTWLRWRAQSLAKFYADLAKPLAKSSPDPNATRKLFVWTANLFEEQPSRQNFLDPRRAVEDGGGTLLAHGIDIPFFGTATDLVLCRPEIDQPLDPIVDRKRSSYLAMDSRLDQEFAKLDHAAWQLSPRSKSYFIEGNEDEKWMGKGKCEAWVYPQCTLTSEVSQKPRIRRMLANDCGFQFEGGIFPALDASGKLRAAIQHLPKSKMQLLEPFGTRREGNLVAIYTGVEDRHAYFAFVNALPTPEAVELDWSLPHVECDWLTDPPQNITVHSNRSLPKSIVVPPNGYLALRVPDDRIQLNRWSRNTDPAFLAQVRRELEQFDLLLNQTAFSKANSLLRDGSFETHISDGTVQKQNPEHVQVSIDWATSMIPTSKFQLDPQNPYQGKYSLRIENQSQDATAWIQTQALPLPSSNRLAMEFYARSEAINPEDSKLTLSIEGLKSNGSKFQLRHELEMPRPDSKSVVDPLGKTSPRPQWKYHLVSLLDGSLQDIQGPVTIALDLRGKGIIWIDEVSIHGLYLLDEERRGLRSEAFVAKRELEAGFIDPAFRLVDGYWSRFIEHLLAPKYDREAQAFSSPSTARNTRTVAAPSLETIHPSPKSPNEVKGTREGKELSNSVDPTLPKSAPSSKSDAKKMGETDKGWLQRWRENWGKRKGNSK